VPFKLSDIGEGIAEVELLKWFVLEGASIKSFDRVCEVQSDKATVEITSRYTGVVRALHHEEGSTVKVGDALMDIEIISNDSSLTAISSPSLKEDLDNSKLPDANDERLEYTKGTELKDESSRYVLRESEYGEVPGILPQELLQLEGGEEGPGLIAVDPGFLTEEFEVVQEGFLATPVVRRLGRILGVNMIEVTGSGANGRILEEDLFAQVNKASSPVEDSIAQESVDSMIGASKHTTLANKHTTVPIRGIQKVMARSMTASLKVPMMALREEVSCDELIKMRKLFNRSNMLEDKMSMMPILIKATSMALKRYPVMNAAVICPDCTEMVMNDDHNIGVAMDTPRGLIVPVLKQVQLKSIDEIAVEFISLQKSALNGSIKENELQGGTFTLSNIGSIGGISATALVVVPQVAIGAIGKLQILPRYKGLAIGDMYTDGTAPQPVPTAVMNVTWSADHRVVDGATVAKFSSTWKHYIETPMTMLRDLK